VSVNFKNVIAVMTVLTAVLDAVACGSGSPSRPTDVSATSPSSTSTSVAGGATINGAITGAALSALAVGGSGFAALDGPGSLLVTVVGTSITASVKPNGTFVLTDVPAGDIQLHFTGPGTDAMLTVTGVAGGDELRMTVQVSGGTATLQELSRKDKLNKIELEGLVVAGDCASFLVGTTTIITDAATQFSKGTCANVLPGTMVLVKGSAQPDGTIRATDVMFKTVETEEEEGEKTKVELEGTVTAGGCGAFTVKNVAVTTDATTVFKNGRCEEIGIGVRLHVRGTPTGPASALATLVNIQRDADDNGRSGDKEQEEEEGRGGGNGRGNSKKD
jgi:hypothetical protein